MDIRRTVIVSDCDVSLLLVSLLLMSLLLVHILVSGICWIIVNDLPVLVACLDIGIESHIGLSSILRTARLD